MGAFIRKALMIIILGWTSLCIITAIFIPYTYTSSQIKASAYIDNEIKMLKPLPGAIYQPVEKYYKAHSRITASVYFTSDLDYQEVASYYDKEFRTSSWTGRIEYHKESGYTASVKKSPDTPHKYSLNIVWNGGLLDILEINYFLRR